MVALEQLRISPDVTDDGVGELRVPEATLADMLVHVAAGLPNEACGVLAGDGSTVMAHYATANAASTPRTFSEIAPLEVLRIWNEIDAHDWQVLAYYHSHPETPAYPSPRDILWSRGWPGTYYIIFSLAEPLAPVVRAFLISGEEVREDRLIVVP
jgi:proteasome lid subunit RPN8/RPN11